MVKVHGTSLLAFSDLWAILDVMSAAVCEKLHLACSSATRQIMIVHNKKAVMIGNVALVPVTVCHMTAELSCLVVHLTPSDLIIARSSLKLMRTTLDFDNDVVTFLHAARLTQI